MLEDVDSHSPIKEFLKDKTIFLTGGFGFIGKLLIEKLLRCDVKRIYLLVRPKKGKSLAERFENLLKEPVSGIERYKNIQSSEFFFRFS
jgi:fatty acyl-CoA reductase